MAKKKTGASRKEVQKFTPETLREMSRELAAVSARLTKLASRMEAAKVESYETTVGNWNNAVKLLKKYLATHVIAKLVSKAADDDKDYETFLENSSDTA